MCRPLMVLCDNWKFGVVSSILGKSEEAEEKIGESINNSTIDEGSTSRGRQKLPTKPKLDKRKTVYIIDLENEDELAESASRETHGDIKGRFHEDKVN